MDISEYRLADSALIKACRAKAGKSDFPPEGELHRLAYTPEAVSVVLGAGNSILSSVHAQACEAERIAVIKRPSGGEAVLVSPNTVCFSSCYLADKLPRSADYFSQNLEFISGVLAALGVQNIERKGISDLCIGDSKFLGSAIYRRLNMILFQAVINLAEPGKTIARYIQHPGRMPDYRANRPHEQFVRSLAEQGYGIDSGELKYLLEKFLYKL